MLRRNSWPSRPGHIVELSIAAVPEQLPRLFEFFANVVLVDERVYMAVGDEEVLPAVIVEIHKCRAPFHVLRMDGQADAAGNVGEISVSNVAIKRVGVV